MNASNNTSPEIITTLLKEGASVNEISEFSSTPLISAAQSNTNPILS